MISRMGNFSAQFRKLSNSLMGPGPVALGSVVMMLATSQVNAGGWRHHHGGYRWGFHPSVSFYYGPGPFYTPYYYTAYTDNYVVQRPNYAVSGTLLGALTGGIIGNSIHHQGWEGAGIGAAAGLLLGGLAEHQARARERAVYATPTSNYYVQPSPTASAAPIADAPTVPAAPTVPDSSGSRSVESRSMSSANSLFGR